MVEGSDPASAPHGQLTDAVVRPRELRTQRGSLNRCHWRDAVCHWPGTADAVLQDPAC